MVANLEWRGRAQTPSSGADAGLPWPPTPPAKGTNRLDRNAPGRIRTMKLRNLLLFAVSLMALSAAAQAQPVTGWYLGAGVGPNGLLEQKGQNGLQFKTSPNLGFGAIASLVPAMGSAMGSASSWRAIIATITRMSHVVPRPGPATGSPLTNTGRW